MCGISGINYFSDKSVDKQIIEKMNKAVFHRGPDDGGVYIDSGIGLGHRRLTIIDLTKDGTQPMCNEDGTVWITYNGEIYNYKELKRELESKGHYFKSKTDTEVIVHGYEEWGMDVSKKLDGMFAYCIWDKRQNITILSRDPFGIKPLFYYFDGEKLVFSSEIKGVLASGLVDRKVNLDALSNFMTYFYTPGPETIVKEIFHVKPGHNYKFMDGKLSQSKYWRINFDDRSLQNSSFEDIQTELREEIGIAIKNSLVADVPIALLLSAGLDSSIILAELAREQIDLETFSVGFADSGYDESSKIKKLAQFYGVKNNLKLFDEEDFARYITKMVYHTDTLSGNPGIPAEYLYLRHASEHVKVALMGTGVDELYAGYITYVANIVRKYYGLLPNKLKRMVKYLASGLPVGASKYNFNYMVGKFSEGAMFSPEKSHYWWRTIFTDEEKSRLFNQPASEDKIILDSFYKYEEFFNELDKNLPINEKCLYADFHMFLMENANVEVDSLSMGFSLEIRPPFLTKRFVDFSYKIPFKHKLKLPQKTKYCLREAYKGVLPDYITKMKKHGLVTPMNRMFKGPLREMITESLLNNKDMEEYFNITYVKSVLDEHYSGKWDHSFKILNLLCFSLWHSLFIQERQI
jgi:asparagine synthase (glutamine-hydrolysing)